MAEQSKQPAQNKMQTMIFMLCGLAVVIVYGLFEYGTSPLVWPTWYLIIAAVCAVWTAFDVLAFLAVRARR